MSWLNRRSWPVYANTKNREAFEAGARVVFYIGGKSSDAQTVIGCGTIAAVRSATSVERTDVGAGEKTPAKVLDFEALTLFSAPVPIRPLLDKLEMFAKVRQRWGVALVGGSRRISGADFEVILNSAKDTGEGAAKSA